VSRVHQLLIVDEGENFIAALPSAVHCNSTNHLAVLSMSAGVLSLLDIADEGRLCARLSTP